ncbi:MAG: GGDEF domain-containing protein [Lachnospiraceae bacterium]|nr:GGDEF domain-containing protein [Lachnospiraceae bacterium]
MMNADRLILEFAQKGLGEIMITDQAGRVLYRNGCLAFDEEDWQHWLDVYLGREQITGKMEWEISDAATERMYRVHSAPVEQDGEQLVIHHLYDVSEDYDLIRDLSAYSRERQQLANFQRALMESMAEGDVAACLPLLLRYMEIEEAVLCVDRGDIVESWQMRKGDSTVYRRREAQSEQFRTVREGHVLSRTAVPMDYLCYMNESTISGQRFALFLPGNVDEGPDTNTFPMQYSVSRLFIENMLLREKIVYESEHDPLTGIYNKGKYLSMMGEVFPHCERIAVFNMDVNYLKHLNDTQGHEMGDKLLIRAGNSLIPLERENVAAFRMGGDEFMLVAWDVSEEEARALKKQWEEQLETLNRADDSFCCVIACGMAYGGSGHDLQALLKEADERMYQDKAAIKRANGDDPDAR